MKSIVYYSKNISPEYVLKLYNLLEANLTGKTAVKVHTGEVGNQNFIKPVFWRPVIDAVSGVVVECNTAYHGERDSTDKHLRTIALHGWNDLYNVDLLDAEGPDAVLPVKNGLRITKNYVGKNLLDYDSLLVLSHFKGHPMGGYGGALKQLSIGCASSKGKSYIHGAGTIQPFPPKVVREHFLESMADAASSVVEMFKGKAAYINVMMNLSVDCDCCAKAENPCMKNIGILASLDPVAIDQACIDFIYKATDDPGQAHFLERLESLNGIHTVEAAEQLCVGTRNYEIINID